MTTVNHVKIGDVVQLIADEEEFRSSFRRFEGDSLNGWDAKKHSMRGKKGTVTEIYDGGALAVLFSNGVLLELPYETVGVIYDNIREPLLTVEMLRNLKGPVSVTVHDHPLVRTLNPYGVIRFHCNGTYLDGRCRGTKYGTESYHCATCGYDLCEDCTAAYAGESGTHPTASLDSTTKFCVVYDSHFCETVDRNPWICDGGRLKGGCKSGYDVDQQITGQTGRYLSQDERIQLCKACFEAYEKTGRRFDSTLREFFNSECATENSDGVKCIPSYDNYHTLEARHYCGRYVGQSGYHQTGCSSCDGVCGPNNGCQCVACYGVDVKPKLSSHQLTRALKQGFKEWRRSKIMIVGAGRAGKTALANSIIGKEYEGTESTVGISQLTCTVNYATLGQGQWGVCAKPEREFEFAIAQNVIAQKKREEATRARTRQADVTTLAQATAPVMKGPKEAERAENHNSVTITDLEMERIEAVKGPADVDKDFILNCLADISFGDNLIISVNDCGGQSVFDAIHHFFLTRYGVYFLVFNMEWLVGATPQIQEKCWSYLRFWMNSIIVHTWSDRAGTTAPIAIIGVYCCKCIVRYILLCIVQAQEKTQFVVPPIMRKYTSCCTKPSARVWRGRRSSRITTLKASMADSWPVSLPWTTQGVAMIQQCVT